MRRLNLEFAGTILMLARVSVAGLGLLMSLGDIPGDGKLNNAYEIVRTTADWMVKAAIVCFSTCPFAFKIGRQRVERGLGAGVANLTHR